MSNVKHVFKGKTIDIIYSDKSQHQTLQRKLGHIFILNEKQVINIAHVWKSIKKETTRKIGNGISLCTWLYKMI